MGAEMVCSPAGSAEGSRLPPWVTRWVRPRRLGPTEGGGRREGGKAPELVRVSVSYSGVDRVARPRRGRGG
jgi:hypothetical protein